MADDSRLAVDGSALITRAGKENPGTGSVRCRNVAGKLTAGRPGFKVGGRIFRKASGAPRRGWEVGTSRTKSTT